MSITRIYLVADKAGKQRLVEATSGAQAIRFCTIDLYSAEPANPKTVASLMAKGTHVETALPENPHATTAP